MSNSRGPTGEITATVALCCQHESEYYDFEKLKAAVSRAVERADERESRFRIRFVPLDDSPSSGQIPAQIQETIEGAAVVIVDLSDVNVNAVYELGLAQGTKTTVITIRERGAAGKLPLDIYALRHFPYDGNLLGELERTLEDKLAEVLAGLNEEDLIPRDHVERILARHLRVIEETRDFTETVYQLLDGCSKNLYYVGAAGLSLTDDNWVQLCRTKLRNVSAHRVVNLKSLEQFYADTRDPVELEEYCVWLGRYYALVKDGIFSLYSSPEVGSRRIGMSFLVFDEQKTLILLGRPGSSFNHKAIMLDHEPAGRLSRQYVLTLALAGTTRKVSAEDMGRYFSLASSIREVPDPIANNADGDPEVLRKACIDYVTEQLELLRSAD
jgi:hypothetical protein